MNNFVFKQMPSYVEREMKIITDHVKPLVKKSSRYTFIAIPMSMMSLMNLFFLIIYNGVNKEVMGSVILFAVFAAIGMALFKESKFLQKEIQQKSNQYIIERIKKSEAVLDYQKREFITLINEQPVLGFHTFINFLEEENKRKI
jgi:hypothetical protein